MLPSPLPPSPPYPFLCVFSGRIHTERGGCINWPVSQMSPPCQSKRHPPSQTNKKASLLMDPGLCLPGLWPSPLECIQIKLSLCFTIVSLSFSSLFQQGQEPRRIKHDVLTSWKRWHLPSHREKTIDVYNPGGIAVHLRAFLSMRMEGFQFCQFCFSLVLQIVLP